MDFLVLNLNYTLENGNISNMCQWITGKGNPKYEYRHVDGNFRATLYLPGIEAGIISDLAPTKKAVGIFLFLVNKKSGLGVPITKSSLWFCYKRQCSKDFLLRVTVLFAINNKTLNWCRTWVGFSLERGSSSVHQKIPGLMEKASSINRVSKKKATVYNYSIPKENNIIKCLTEYSNTEIIFSKFINPTAWGKKVSSTLSNKK